MRWLAAIALVACQDDTREISLYTEHHSRGTFAGVPIPTVYVHDAGDQSSLLVMLHGRGDTPEGFRATLRNFPVKLELAFPRGLLPVEHGRAWFDERTGDASNAETALWPALVELANGRKFVVGGIDQGAAVAIALATDHPDVITCVIPIAGHEITPATYDVLVKQVRACIP